MSAFCELSRSRIIRVDCREGSHPYTILAAALTILASHSTAHFPFPLNIHLIFPTPTQTSSYPSSTPQKSQFFLPRQKTSPKMLTTIPLSFPYIQTIIQMLIPQKQSITSTIRHLCQEIENQINNLIKKFTASPNAPQRTPTELHKLQHERNFQEMKNSIIQTLTSRLPLLIDYEESMNEQVEDVTEERDQWMQKCKELTIRWENEKMENERLGCEVNAISESYSQLSVNFEELKYKYHELQEKEYENRRNSEHKTYLEKLNDLNLLSKDSGTNSASSQRDNPNQNIKNTTEMMLYEKEMFLEEIRSSQKEIFAFRTKIEELMEENERLEKENREFEQLLMGQKLRCDKFDREILEILNKNQQLKLDVLQQKESALQNHEQAERVNLLLQEEQTRVTALRSENEELKKEIFTHKQTINELKTQTSQNREEYSVLEEKQREQKQKITELKKQNQQLRTQLEKIIHKLTQTTNKYEKTKHDQILRYKHQLQEERSKNSIYEKESRSKNQEKVHEISKMHKEITQKLQQKIHLLQRGNKEKKEKMTQLKYEVERLYESLQIQVEKEFKSAEQIKGLTAKLEEVDRQNKSLKEQLTKAVETKQHLQETSKKQKFQLYHTQKKLKKITQINTKLVSFTLPKIKEELHSTRLLCQHFCTMIDMEKQQIGFLLTKKQEHFQQLIEQTLLQKTIHKEQANMSHMTELNKWKENCKIYEEKYDRLKNTYDHLEEKHQKLEMLYEEETKTYSEQLTALQDEYQKKRVEQANTRKTIEVLKDKCKEVEQYYKLVEDLSKENMVLKNKLETASYYSFKSPEKNELDNTSKRQKFTSEEQLQKYSKTTNMARLHSRGDEYNVNDLTAKAQFQRMRLQAAKREYNMINRPEHQ